MTSERGEGFGFALAHDAPIPYMQRIRDYYVTLGYGTPYEWAHYARVPFQPLKKPLAESRVTILTTASPYQPDKGDQGPGAPYNSAAKFYKVYSGDTAKDHDLRVSHVGIDRKHTTAEDSGTWFPLPELRRAAARGRIGSLAPRFHGLPTNRSHRVTLEIDCPEVVARCKADGVDAAIILPNCPVCHQSASLAARALEESGIATVVMGCAKDIVEYVGVPRLLFSDFPLGNAAGRPKDADSQAFTLELALRVLETAPAARTTVQSPLRLERQPRLEARLPEHRPDVARGDRAPARRVRQAEGGRQEHSRGGRCSAPRQQGRREGKGRMTKPFAGVRVLDFTQVFAGPFGSYQLALLGADVIKIERPGGEDMRRSPLNKEWAARNMATAWMAINSNKRNIALDLTKPKSIEIVHRLARRPTW